MRAPRHDEITVTFDPFRFSGFTPGGFPGFAPGGLSGFAPGAGSELARTLADAQLRLAQAVFTAAWTAQLGFLRATATALQEAQGRVADGLLRGVPR